MASGSESEVDMPPKLRCLGKSETGFKNLPGGSFMKHCSGLFERTNSSS